MKRNLVIVLSVLSGIVLGGVLFAVFGSRTADSPPEELESLDVPESGGVPKPVDVPDSADFNIGPPPKGAD